MAEIELLMLDATHKQVALYAFKCYYNMVRAMNRTLVVRRTIFLKEDDNEAARHVDNVIKENDKVIEALEELLTVVDPDYCQKCGSHFAAHNDDGSCVED